MTKARKAFEIWDKSPDNPYLIDVGYGEDQKQGAYDNADEVETAFIAGYEARVEEQMEGQ